MPKFNIGFGDPADPTFDAIYSADAENGGFGDDTGPGLGGFGDLDMPPLLAPVMVGTPDGYAMFHDEGGEIVRLYGGPFGLVNPALLIDGHTTYRVRLRGPNGMETLYPSTGSCYSASAGDGEIIKPSAASTILKFALPPLPLGAYVVLVYKSDDLVTPVWEVEEMILIERRKRDAATYRTRDRLHQIYLTGPRRARQEPPYPA
jgi:hypothetical protein